MKEQTLARTLANFSLGLGLAELLAPRQVARLIGVNEEHATTLRLMGLREIASGLGIMQGKTGLFLWSRVAGDVMDLALLAGERKSGHGDSRRIGIAMAAVGAVTVLDVVAASLCSRSHSEPGWRVASPGGYRAGIERDDPSALRDCCDDAMERFQSGHVTSNETGAVEAGKE